MRNFLIHLFGGLTQREVADREEAATYATQADFRDRLNKSLGDLGIDLSEPIQAAYTQIEKDSNEFNRLGDEIERLTAERKAAGSNIKMKREALGFLNI